MPSSAWMRFRTLKPLCLLGAVFIALALSRPASAPATPSITTMPDGKLLVGGSGAAGPTVVELTRSGRLNRSFGDAGSKPLGYRAKAKVTGIAARPGGGIDVVVDHPHYGQSHYFRTPVSVVQLTPSGNFDMGFGDRGRAKAFVGDTGGSGGLGFDAGGALYVVGFSCAANSDAFCAYEQLIAKLGDDGQLDAGYGDGGVASIFDSSIDPVAYTGFTAVAPEPDGTVLVGGAPGLPDHGDSAIARLLPDGSPDPAFGGGDGLVETPTPVTDIYPKPSGKILVGGATGDWCCRRAAGQIFGLQRLEPDGSSDPAFAGGGLAHLKRGALTNTTGSFSLLGSGGSIVAGETFGDCRPRHPVADGTCRARLAALRFKPDGIASDSFGRGGPTLRMLGQERQQSGSVPSEGADTVTTPGKLFVAAATPSSGIPITRVLAYSTGGVRIMSFGKRGTVKLPMG